MIEDREHCEADKIKLYGHGRCAAYFSISNSNLDQEHEHE
jgi:hypothetical protein